MRTISGRLDDGETNLGGGLPSSSLSNRSKISRHSSTCSWVSLAAMDERERDQEFRLIAVSKRQLVANWNGRFLEELKRSKGVSF